MLIHRRGVPVNQQSSVADGWWRVYADSAGTAAA